MKHFQVIIDVYEKPFGDLYIWLPTEGREPVYQVRTETRFHLVSLDSCFPDLWFNTAREIQNYVEEHNGEMFVANGVVGISQFIMNKEHISSYIDERKITSYDAVAVLAKITTENPELGITSKAGKVELSNGYETTPTYKVKADIADGRTTYTSDVYKMIKDS